MGQYFKVMNVDRAEWFNLGLAKATETVTSASNGAALLFLLANDDKFAVESELLGRWRGDDIRVVGDYHPDDLYGATRDEWVVEIDERSDDHTTDITTHTVTEGGTGPIDPAKSTVDMGDAASGWTNGNSSATVGMLGDEDRTIVHILKQDEPSEGDYYLINGDKLDGDRFNGDDDRPTSPDYVCRYVETVENEWDNIESELENTLRQFFTDEDVYHDLNEVGRLKPDLVLFDDNTAATDPVSSTEGDDVTNNPDGNATLSQFTAMGSEATDSDNTENTQLVLANRETNEYICLPGTQLEMGISDPVTDAMVTYAMLDSEQDGTRFTSMHNLQSPEVEEAVSEKMQQERETEDRLDKSSMYRNDDGSWNKEKMIAPAMAGRMISDDFMFAGRWQSDALVVDTAENLVDGETAAVEHDDWYDITDRLRNATQMFVGNDYVSSYSGPLATKTDTSEGGGSHTPADD